MTVNDFVGYWPFDEGSGTVAYDFSANANHGSFQSADPQWVAGKFGYAVYFPAISGGGKQITKTTPSGLQFYGTQPFSFFCWVNPTLSQQGGVVGIDKNVSGHFYGWSLGITTAGKLAFEYNDSTGTDRNIQSAAGVNANQLNFVGFVITGGTSIAFYINNVKVTSTSLTNQLNNDGVLPLFLGYGDYQGATGSCVETLDEMRFYSRALGDGGISIGQTCTAGSEIDVLFQGVGSSPAAGAGTAAAAEGNSIIITASGAGSESAAEVLSQATAATGSGTETESDVVSQVFAAVESGQAVFAEVVSQVVAAAGIGAETAAVTTPVTEFIEVGLISPDTLKATLMTPDALKVGLLSPDAVTVKSQEGTGS